jgi:hypothetical protein
MEEGSMRRRIVVLFLTALMVMGLALPAPAATASDFGGVWTSTDAADGSDQVLLLIPRGRSGSVGAILFDDGGSIACGDVTVPVIGIGQGTVSGDDLTVGFRLKCLDGSPSSTATVVYTLQPDGTMTENLTATVWMR